MKKIYMTLAMMAMMAVPTVALAQEEGDEDMGDVPVYPTLKTGYYRIINNGYGDVLSTNSKYAPQPSETESSARTLPASIFYYDTDGQYFIQDDLDQLEVDENGQYVDGTAFMNLMNSNGWKSGSYSTYDMTSQGVSFGAYLHKLEEFVMKAIDNFPESEEVKDFYENGPLWFLVVSSLLYPADAESLESFQNWVRQYSSQWKPFFDCNVYLKPVENTDNTFRMHFHTPLQPGDIKNLQQRLASMGYTLDIWATLQKKVLEEIAKEYPKDSEAYSFMTAVISQIDGMNREFYIGEGEDGNIKVKGFSPSEATFGETGELLEINWDEMNWIMQPVNEENPLMVEMNKGLQDVDGNYYTTMFTEFPYELKDGVEAYYIDAVNDGVAHLTQIEGKVPAMTGVILRSKSYAAVSNTLIPVDEEVAAIEGNLLKGTCLPMKDAENVSVMRLVADGQTGNIVMGKAGQVAANECYIDTPEDGSNVIIAASQNVDPTAISLTSTPNTQHPSPIYDLQGRRVVNPTKGLYIQNGRKAVVR